MPIAYSSNHPAPYKTNLDKKQYSFIISLIDKNLLHNAIQEAYSSEIQKEDAKFKEFEYTNSDINILRQFEHWYEAELKNIN
ncbi:MAG: hypothetical protein ACOXZQ_06690 [Bacteroidales bacterium]